jgi:MraZ protein
LLFQGATTLNLDVKGRMAIPAKYRGSLAEDSASRVVVTIHPTDSCLWLYPETQWVEIAQTVAALPPIVPQNRALQRLLLGNAVEMEMDSQGRILLSGELRNHAALDKRVTVVGQGNKFEIWDEAAWAGTLNNLVAEAGQLGSELSDVLRNLSL